MTKRTLMFLGVAAVMSVAGLTACKSETGTGGGNEGGNGSGNGGSGSGNCVYTCAEALDGVPLCSDASDSSVDALSGAVACASGECAGECAGFLGGYAMETECSSCLQGASCSEDFAACSNDF